MSRLDIAVELELGGFALSIRAALELSPITAVFGPSGSGKTSLLRFIAGLEPRAIGHLRIDDSVWQDSTVRTFVPAHRRRVGYVFQDGRLFPHLDVEGNLRFGYRDDARRLRFDQVVAAMDLHGMLDRKPTTLSGGEQQRVAIARALLTDPALMLMDEPLSALDVRRKSSIIPYIERVAHEFDVPILYVTHSIEEVSRLATQMLVLAGGRLVADGDVTSLLERIELWPAGGPVRAGAILEAEVLESRDGMTVLRAAGRPLRLPAIDVEPGTTVRLHIDAKDVAIAIREPEGLSIRNVLEARIVKIDAAAPVLTEILLDVGGQHLRAEITREAATELRLEPGKDVYALIKSVAIDRSLLA